MKLAGSIFKKWNKKIHIYLGLFLILFLWVFAVSGLFLNHPKWFGGQPNRVGSEAEVTMLDSDDQLAKAHDLMTQLDLSGEVIFRGTQRPGQFAFIAMKPNERHFVNVALESNVAKITRVTGNIGQMMGNLHTFSGVRPIWGERPSVIDWLPTRLWSISIDALSIGVILLVASSLYMGFSQKEVRRGAVLSLIVGLGVCGFFIWGLV